jgi:hypothetical protein
MSLSRRSRVAALSLALTAPLATATVAATTAQAASCVYRVIYGGAAPVRENPDTNSVIRKHKYYGEIVTSGCAPFYDPESGVVFVEVNCGCASDGQGWMRRSYLEYLEL